MTLRGCEFEASLTQAVGQDASGQARRNIVDDYLKRRGWTKPLPTRRPMQDVRHSVMRLYRMSCQQAQIRAAFQHPWNAAPSFSSAPFTGFHRHGP